jgi:hypothetical protein
VRRREQLARGRGEQLPGRTFSAPRKWMKGKGRITIQYGVCYSYAFPQARDGVVHPRACQPRSHACAAPRSRACLPQGITEDVVEAMPRTLEGA